MRKALPDAGNSRVWDALVLAAGRGADPLSSAFAVSHKCLLPVAGQSPSPRPACELLEAAAGKTAGP